MWRLTPQVYRYQKADAWRVKHDPRLYGPDGFKERSAFVLANMTSILLARQNTKRAARYIEGSNFSDVKVKAGAKFYEKADKSGPVAGVLPEGKDQASISCATQGLNDEDWYWRAMYENGGGAPAVVVGYVLEADLIGE